MSFLFYKKNEESFLNKHEKYKEYNTALWKPSFVKISPYNSLTLPYSIWWLFHYLHFFSNRNYCVNVIFHKNKVIHQSLVTPRYFRFPFMKKDDLQIGDIWTDPLYRGQGIATYSIFQIFKHFYGKKITFWYIVDENNATSIHLAEKLGFTLYGKGVRQSRFGICAIGQYVITNNDLL